MASPFDRVNVRTFVNERLRARPGAFKIPAPHVDMFTLRDFLSGEECKRLIKMIDRKRQPSTVLGGHPDMDFRTSETCNLDPYDPFVQTIEDKMTDLMGIPPEQGETIQGQRYAIGQQFKQHHDFFFTDQPYWEEQKDAGGQRTWTAMVFLNQPEAGGETFFAHAAVKIAPRAGNLLAWYNLDAAGKPNLFSLHEGRPVEAGVKYIITKWYRERRWGPEAPAID
ncbi:MAG TPA: 2OG-Fe(II) oxygenase [Allosphingosinicella sp.]|nr:2OG-Fe(II) oxygenase [Allosphingosinicella sp.]